MPTLNLGKVTGDTGPAGPQGPIGNTGPQGAAATITIGNVITGNAGANASVTNSGNSSAAVLDFVIPRGEQGQAGESASIDSGNIAYVQLNGNDATAVVGRPDLPFATAQAALQALFEIRFDEAESAYDENGQPLPALDENGDPIMIPIYDYLFDPETGDQIWDENGDQVYGIIGYEPQFASEVISPKLLHIGVGQFEGINLDLISTTNGTVSIPSADLLPNGISISGKNPYASRLGGINASFELGLRGDRSVNLGDISSVSVGLVNAIVRDIFCTNMMNLVEITARNLTASNAILLQSGCIAQSAAGSFVTPNNTKANYIGQPWYYES